MVKFKIEDTTYEITERFSIEQWKQIVKWDFEHKPHWPRIISTATGAPLEYLQEVTEESLELGIVFIATVINSRKEVAIKDFNDITFGEWIDLDIYLNYGVDKHIEDILAILSPKLKWANEALWVIEKYSEWRLFIYKQYGKLFGLDEKESSSEGPQMDIAKSWYNVIISLAQEDLLKIDAVTDQPLKKALNFMAYKKEKMLQEQERQLKQKRQNDLLRHS
jgi:hypothetical protein